MILDQLLNFKPVTVRLKTMNARYGFKLACSFGHINIVEMLLDRRANINHQNTAGNTPLHYAMAYETRGDLGEYLIGRGADDMLENKKGLSPYDGLD